MKGQVLDMAVAEQRLSAADAALAAIFSPAGVDDPYPLYARLRAEAPVHRGPGGGWYLSSHAACCHIKGPQFGVGGRTGAIRSDWHDHPALTMASGSMAMQDPPDHTRLRRLVTKAFTPGRITQLRPRVETFVDGLLDDLAEGGAVGTPVDFMHAFALRLPVAVIGELLGMPRSTFDTIGPLVTTWMSAFDPASGSDDRILGQADRAATEICELLTDVVSARRDRPADDLLTDLIRVEDGGEHLTTDELLSTANLLYIAGYITTSHLLGNALVALADAPDQAELLRTDPGCVTTAIEEFLRYDGPVQINNRVAMEDVTILGVRIPAGDPVTALSGAANRDPDVFDRPDVLDLRRQYNPHVSFGGGIHYCLGAALGRMEAAVALPAVLRRFPGLRMAPGALRTGNAMFWGYHRLPIVI